MSTIPSVTHDHDDSCVAWKTSSAALAHDTYRIDLASRLREDARPRSTPVPVIVYGHGLKAEDIERAAGGGAMWLQLEPSDLLKLVAAIRGVLAAAGVVIKQPNRNPS